MTFAERYETALARLAAQPNDPIADWRVLRVPGNLPPWMDTDIMVSEGDEITWLADGRVVISEELGLWGGPCFYLWARIGQRGHVFKGTRETFSFRAEEEGPLLLATYQGEWGTREGELATPLEAYDAVQGEIDVAVIRWKRSAAEGIRALRTAMPDDPLVAAEQKRLASPAVKPPGWEYLWFLGEGEIFTAKPRDGRSAIAVHTREDVGILQKKIDVALTPQTTVSWKWLVSKLPAREAENTIPTHDYLSIALEFENGLDLTYYWSAALPVGTVFTCPLPTWAARETHVVARSGPDGLGTWQSETRNLYADYIAALGEAPKRIVGVWLIAVSIFKHGEGVAEFADITIADADGAVHVA
jgi:hypothetical protein